MKLGAVIVAAGASRRLGSPKTQLTFEGETFLARLCRHFSLIATKLVVVQRPGLHLHTAPGIEIIENPNPERGMLSSLQCGLNQLPDADNVIFSPVDYAPVKLATIEALAAAHLGPLTLPTYKCKRGHPAIINRQVINQLLSLAPTESPKTAIYSYLERACLVEVDDPRVVEDVDTPEDYQRLLYWEQPHR